MRCQHCGIENIWDENPGDAPSPEVAAKRTRDTVIRAADAALAKTQSDANLVNREARANAEAAYYAEMRRIREAKP